MKKQLCSRFTISGKGFNIFQKPMRDFKAGNQPISTYVSGDLDIQVKGPWTGNLIDS